MLGKLVLCNGRQTKDEFGFPNRLLLVLLPAGNQDRLFSEEKGDGIPPAGSTRALKHLNMFAGNNITTVLAGVTGDSCLQISGGHQELPCQLHLSGMSSSPVSPWLFHTFSSFSNPLSSTSLLSSLCPQPMSLLIPQEEARNSKTRAPPPPSPAALHADPCLCS